VAILSIQLESGEIHPVAFHSRIGHDMGLQTRAGTRYGYRLTSSYPPKPHTQGMGIEGF